METKLGLAYVIGCLLISTPALLVVGCGNDSAEPTSASPGGAGEGAGGADGSPAAGGADSGVEHGGSDSGRGGSESDRGGSASSGTGAGPHVDPGGPIEPGGPGAGGADGGADSLDFDGVDVSDASEDAPSGCVGGFDSATGTLAITIDETAPVVRLAVHAGVVQANGVDCASEAGAPATAEAVLALSISGGDGDDVLYLDSSDEPFSGALSEAGSISVALGEGTDRVAVLGTNGADVIHVGSEAGELLVDLNADQRADLTISGAPRIVLSTGAKNDQVRADGVALGIDPAALPLEIYGGGAGDQLVGGAAADYLSGGIGNDWFDAGAAPAGADTFDGGDGQDAVDFSAREAAIVITMGAGADDGEADEGVDVTASVEDVYGGQGTNTITGGAADNRIWGGPEADVIDGGPGGDILVGGAGDDELKGGEGDDYLYGEDGDDDLEGGAGDDLLDGFEGKNSLNGGPGDGDICFVTKNDKASGCEL